jgi:hypothetical protein
LRARESDPTGSGNQAFHIGERTKLDVVRQPIHDAPRTQEDRRTRDNDVTANHVKSNLMHDERRDERRQNEGPRDEGYRSPPHIPRSAEYGNYQQSNVPQLPMYFNPHSSMPYPFYNPPVPPAFNGHPYSQSYGDVFLTKTDSK